MFDNPILAVADKHQQVVAEAAVAVGNPHHQQSAENNIWYRTKLKMSLL